MTPKVDHVTIKEEDIVIDRLFVLLLNGKLMDSVYRKAFPLVWMAVMYKYRENMLTVTSWLVWPCIRKNFVDSGHAVLWYNILLGLKTPHKHVDRTRESDN